MGTKLTTEEFFNRVKTVHGELYSYRPDFVYKNSHDYIDIECDKHGWFKQKAYAHLSGQGCLQCGNDISASKRLNDRNDVLSKIKEIHGDTYSYENTVFGRSKDKIDIVCKDHGVFSIELKSHLRGTGCNHCAIERNANLQKFKTFISFVSESNTWYNDYYTYDMSKFIYRGDVTVTCPVHGEFQTTYTKHKNGNGCSECHPKARPNTTSYLKSNYIRVCGDHGSILYVLKLTDKDGTIFYKIGISNNVKRRLSEIPYDTDVVLNVFSKDVGWIWQTERELHKRFKKTKYKPLKSFGGATECFTLTDKNLDEIKTLIQGMCNEQS